MHPFAGGLVVNKRAHGDFQDDGFAFTAGAVGAFPVASALRCVFRIEAEMDQRVMAFAGFHNDVATAPAIAARRATPRHKLFPTEGHAAIAAATGFDSNCGFIDEHSKL